MRDDGQIALADNGGGFLFLKLSGIQIMMGLASIRISELKGSQLYKILVSGYKDRGLVLF